MKPNAFLQTTCSCLLLSCFYSSVFLYKTVLGLFPKSRNMYLRVKCIFHSGNQSLHVFFDISVFIQP